jgi:MFS superfamily sulfate permease-like transporter
LQRFKFNKLGSANLRGDLFGGLTAAIVAVPLALAFGVASGAGPLAGLYSWLRLGRYVNLMPYSDHARMFDPDTAQLMRENRERIMFLHLSGLISFGAANELLRKFSVTGSYDVLIIDLLDVPKVDGSAALALEEVIQQATEQQKTVFIVGLTYHVARLMSRMGCLDLVREAERFDSRPDAVRAAVALLKNQ